jgi:drug/metabolite transporter (DMT)-like permease
MSSTSKKKRVFAQDYFFLIIGLTIIFWALAFPFIKIGLTELSPVNLTIMRLLVVCIVFIIFLVSMPNRFSKIKKNDIIPIFLLGFFGIIVYHLGLNWGEQYISPSTASLIIATIPIYIVILATIFLHEKITLKIVFGIILSSLGVIIISTLGTPNFILEIRYILGAVAVLIAALVGAVYTIGGKKLLTRYSPLSLTVYAFLLGSLGLIPFLSMSLFEQVSSLSLIGLGVIIFLGLCPTVIAYVLWYVALEIKTASELGVYLYFIPVLATIFSFVLLQEEITWLFILGGALVIIGLYIVNKNAKKDTIKIK